MILNLKARKLRLIQEIMGIYSTQTFLQIEREVQAVIESEYKKASFWEAIKPIKATSSIEEMIVEQDYKPIKKEDFYRKTAKLKIEEPLEDLLSMLKS